MNNSKDIPLILKWNEVDESTPLPAFIQHLLDKASKEPFFAERPAVSSSDWIDMDMLIRYRELASEFLYQMFLLPLVITAGPCSYIPSFYRMILRDGKNPDNTPDVVAEHFKELLFGIYTWCCESSALYGGEADKVMRKAFYLHKYYYNRLNTNKEKYDEKFTEDENLDNLTDEEVKHVRLFQLMEEDLSKHIKAPKINVAPPENPDAVYGSQLDFVLLQTIYLVALLGPGERTGIDSEEKREAVIYVIRLLFSVFGLKDEYNLAIGTVEEVQRKLNDVMTFVMGPLIRSPTLEMRRHVGAYANTFLSGYRVLTVGAWVSLIIARFLQVETPASIWNEASISDKLIYYSVCVTEYLTMKFTIVRKVFNLLTKRILDNCSTVMH